MISSPSGSPKTLVFRRQISSPNSKGFPPNRGLKQGSVGKIQRYSTFKLQYLKNGSRYGSAGIRSFPGWLLSPDGFFPGKTFPGKSFPGWSFSPDRTFPGKTIPGWSLSRKVVSRVVIFPDDYETFPGKTS